MRRSARRVLSEAHVQTRKLFMLGLSALAGLFGLLTVSAMVGGHPLPRSAPVVAAASMSLAVIAFLAHRRSARPDFDRWAAAACVHWAVFTLVIHAMSPRAWPVSVESSLGFAFLFAATLVPFWGILVVGGATLAASALLGLPWVLDLPGAPLESLHVVPMLSFVTASALVGFRLWVFQSHIHGPIEAVLDDLERRRDALAASLASRERDLERTVERLLDAQKLDRLRAISRKLAHELNNALTPLRGTAELLSRARDEEQRRRYVRRILRASNVAADLAESLLAYTRQGLFAPVPTDIGRYLQSEILPGLSVVLPENVHLETEFEAGLYVSVDRPLMRHMIEQLLDNAVWASPEGGTITVAVRSASLGPSGGGVEILVRDEGVGMTEQVRERALDPFFSTRGPGGGRGLGLAMVDGIVARHGGRLEIDSTEGRGTTVRVFLPRASGAHEGPGWVFEAGTRARVVVLTKDADVRDVVEDILEGLQVQGVVLDEVASVARQLDVYEVAAVIVDAGHPEAAQALSAARAARVFAFTTDAETSQSHASTVRGVPHVPLDPGRFSQILRRKISKQ